MVIELSARGKTGRTYEFNENRVGKLRVIKYLKSNGKRISLLATDERILCYQPKENGPWLPCEAELWSFAQGLNHM
jgi:hypothetical protein